MNASTAPITKKHTLIQTALTLFYQHGIHAVGINEVIKASGIAKKTLYNHFASKDELILATLKARDKAFLTWLDKRLQPMSSNQQVALEVFHALNDWFNNKVPHLMPFRGCFFINTAAEYDDTNSAISQYCQQHKHRVRQLIKHKMPSPQDELIDLICLLKEGAIVTAHVNRDNKAADKCLPVILQYVK